MKYNIVNDKDIKSIIFEPETIDDILLMMNCLPNEFVDATKENKEMCMMLYGECFTLNGKIIPFKYCDIITKEINKK